MRMYICADNSVWAWYADAKNYCDLMGFLSPGIIPEGMNIELSPYSKVFNPPLKFGTRESVSRAAIAVNFDYVNAEFVD